MDIGNRLRQLREYKELSQGDLERRTGLLRCYISRVENGHTIPSIETLEKLSRALEVHLYQLFIGHEESIEQKDLRNGNYDKSLGRKGERVLAKLRASLGQMSKQDRSLLLLTAEKMIDLKTR